MNHLAFIQYISHHLHTNIRVYNRKSVLLHSFCAVYDFIDPIIEQINMESILDFKEYPYPKVISVGNRIAYASIPTPKHIYLLGPVKFVDPVIINSNVNGYIIEDEWLKTVFSCNYQDFIDDILLIYNLHYEHMLERETLIANTCNNMKNEQDVNKYFSEILFNNQEIGSLHNPYNAELILMDSIKNGDLVQLEKCWNMKEFKNMYGTFSKERLRNIKNLCIAVVTLASRAAIQGGVQPEIAFSLCDSYAQKIEECQDSVSLSLLTHKAEKHYTELVASIRLKSPNKAKFKKSPHIEACKDYIFTHLHNKISVNEIAESLHINANYLSNLFKKYEGQTIMQYILQEKIKLAQNFLMYSPYSYSEIATYLGFSSQSHLGAQFKKITRMTLREYRNTYGIKEFIE